MRTAIITDTNSGISNEMAKELGIYILPMPFSISGKEYLEGVDLDKETFFERQIGGADIYTSQPSILSISELWDSLLKEHDEIVHIPMSSGLSGSYQTARMLSMEDKYSGKVFVVDNNRISITQLRATLDAKEMVDKGYSAMEVAEFLEKTKYDATIYVTVDTLKYLKKGGRITPAVAAIGTLLKIKPVLTIQGDKLDKWNKARTMKQARAMMINAIKNDILDKFDDADGSKSDIFIVHSNTEDLAKDYMDEVRNAFPNTGEIKIYDLSLSIVTHVGPGTIALAAVKKYT